MPRPKATEPTVNFTLGLPKSLRDTFVELAAHRGEVPTLLIRKLIRGWLHKHPKLPDTPAFAPAEYDNI